MALEQTQVLEYILKTRKKMDYMIRTLLRKHISALVQVGHFEEIKYLGGSFSIEDLKFSVDNIGEINVACKFQNYEHTSREHYMTFKYAAFNLKDLKITDIINESDILTCFQDESDKRNT